MGSSAKTEARKPKIENTGPAARDDDEIIRPHISGDFRGWTGNTTFQLKKGSGLAADRQRESLFPQDGQSRGRVVPVELGGLEADTVNEGLWVKVKRIHPLRRADRRAGLIFHAGAARLKRPAPAPTSHAGAALPPSGPGGAARPARSTRS